MTLQARWLRQEDWRREPEARRAIVTGEGRQRFEPTGLTIRARAYPFKIVCGYRDCVTHLASAWVGANHVELRAGFLHDARSGVWRLSDRVEKQWRDAYRAGVSWNDFEVAARNVERRGQEPGLGRPDLMPAVDTALPVLVRCPLCKFVNEIVPLPP